AVDIDDAFITKLRELRDDPEELQKQLTQLSVKQLRQLAMFLESPVRSKSARQTIIAELIRHFHSEAIWKRISELRPEQSRIVEPPIESLVHDRIFTSPSRLTEGVLETAEKGQACICESRR